MGQLGCEGGVGRRGAFERGGITIHQVLAVRQGEHGRSGMPATRPQWLGWGAREPVRPALAG